MTHASSDFRLTITRHEKECRTCEEGTSPHRVIVERRHLVTYHPIESTSTVAQVEPDVRHETNESWTAEEHSTRMTTTKYTQQQEERNVVVENAQAVNEADHKRIEVTKEASVKKKEPLPVNATVYVNDNALKECVFVKTLAPTEPTTTVYKSVDIADNVEIKDRPSTPPDEHDQCVSTVVEERHMDTDIPVRDIGTTNKQSKKKNSKRSEEQKTSLASSNENPPLQLYVLRYEAGDRPLNPEKDLSHGDDSQLTEITRTIVSEPETKVQTTSDNNGITTATTVVGNDEKSDVGVTRNTIEYTPDNTVQASEADEPIAKLREQPPQITTYEPANDGLVVKECSTEVTKEPTPMHSTHYESSGVVDVPIMICTVGMSQEQPALVKADSTTKEPTPVCTITHEENIAHELPKHDVTSTIVTSTVVYEGNDAKELEGRRITTATNADIQPEAHSMAYGT